MEDQFNFEEWTFRVFRSYHQIQGITSLIPDGIFQFTVKYKYFSQPVWRAGPKKEKNCKKVLMKPKLFSNNI